jgi:ABC-type branched-subunit amino acid transport system substrate-binding protein
MKNKAIVAVSVLLVALVLSTLCLSCGGGGDKKQTKTIVMGFLTDMTGPASSFLVKTDVVYSDLADYINKNDPIPGAEIKLVWYDTQYDPSRDLLGYEYLKGKGADVIFSGIPTVGDTLKTIAARDQIVVLSSAPSTYQLVPPGRVLCQTPPVGWVMKGFLKWISENDWDYQAKGRKPRIGSVGWEEPYHKDVSAAIKDYVGEHPDKFEYVAGPVAPMSTMSWYGEVETLKNCDYIYLPSTGLGIPTFVNEYRGKGYQAKFLGLDAMGAFTELIVDSTGWDNLDGTLTAHTTPYWTDQSPAVDAAKELLQTYHPEDKDSIVKSGLGYISEYFCAQVQFELLRHTVEKVGAKNFDSKAYFDAAADFNWTADGIAARGYGFTATRLYARQDFRVYEWSAQAKNLTAVSDWEPDWEPS